MDTWTLGHRRVGRLPRHRTAMGGATLNAPSQPFGRTTANLASGSACCTARLLCHDLRVKMAHRRRPLLLIHLLRLAPCLVVRLRCLALVEANYWGAHIPTHERY